LSVYDDKIVKLALALRFVLTAVSEAKETIHDPFNAVAVGHSFTGWLRETFCHLLVDPQQSIWNSIVVRNDPIQGSFGSHAKMVNRQAWQLWLAWGCE
jgi:hypothetical protein